MSEENGPGDLERDGSGRFQKRPESADPQRPSADDDMHPVAKALFGWVGLPGVGRMIFWGLAALSLVLILLDFGMSRHDKVETANATGFYGIYGFLAFAFVVLAGWPLGRLLRRDENYYGDQDEPADGGRERG
ncbi:MAG: hypothetical protein AAFX03_04995 [Pseudomonadota bacterium]